MYQSPLGGLRDKKYLNTEMDINIIRHIVGLFTQSQNLVHQNKPTKSSFSSKPEISLFMPCSEMARARSDD